jgi:hypothetical protein
MLPMETAFLQEKTRIARSLPDCPPLSTLADDYDKFGFHHRRGNAMFKKILLAAKKSASWDGQIPKPVKAWALVIGAVAFCLVLGCASDTSPQAVAKSKTRVTAPFRPVSHTFNSQSRASDPPAVKLAESAQQVTWASQEKQPTKSGYAYETYIPRPTKKGYYEPKVVPYPTEKPVYVSGYYRSNGTYVRPHFRSLPRR